MTEKYLKVYKFLLGVGGKSLVCNLLQIIPRNVEKEAA